MFAVVLEAIYFLRQIEIITFYKHNVAVLKSQKRLKYIYTNFF